MDFEKIAVISITNVLVSWDLGAVAISATAL
jgi:hypothetical protein